MLPRCAVLKQQDGISYELTSMSTIIEGELNMIWRAIEALHEAPFLSGARAYRLP